MRPVAISDFVHLSGTPPMEREMVDFRANFVDEHVLVKLERHMWRSTLEDIEATRGTEVNAICAICLDEMNNSECVTLPCGHCLHIVCAQMSEKHELMDKGGYLCPECREMVSSVKANFFSGGQEVSSVLNASSTSTAAMFAGAPSVPVHQQAIDMNNHHLPVVMSLPQSTSLEQQQQLQQQLHHPLPLSFHFVLMNGIKSNVVLKRLLEEMLNVPPDAYALGQDVHALGQRSNSDSNNNSYAPAPHASRYAQPATYNESIGVNGLLVPPDTDTSDGMPLACTGAHQSIPHVPRHLTVHSSRMPVVLQRCVSKEELEKGHCYVPAGTADQMEERLFCSGWLTMAFFTFAITGAATGFIALLAVLSQKK